MARLKCSCMKRANGNGTRFASVKRRSEKLRAAACPRRSTPDTARGRMRPAARSPPAGARRELGRAVSAEELGVGVVARPHPPGEHPEHGRRQRSGAQGEQHDHEPACATTAAATRHSPRTTQSTLFGTVVLLSTRVTQQELLEALHHAGPVHGFHRHPSPPTHRREQLGSSRHAAAAPMNPLVSPGAARHAGHPVLDVHVGGGIVVGDHGETAGHRLERHGCRTSPSRSGTGTRRRRRSARRGRRRCGTH